MVHPQKFYVVTVGKEPGVYSSWIEAGPKTRNIPGGAIYQGFYSSEEAIRAFEAALARGEVKAYPDAGKKDKSNGKTKNAPLSPLEEASLLNIPLDSKEDTRSTAYGRVSKPEQTLMDPRGDPCSTFSSPPTGVTQRYAPLYEDDSPPRTPSPVVRPSPHFTFTSISSRAYPVVSERCLSETRTREIPLQLDVSDWSLLSLTPSSSDSHLCAEEHTSRPPGCMPPHPELLPKSKGVEYRNLTDLVDTESVDSRVWVPKSRIFDPDKVKPRPLTRPSSPVRRDGYHVPNYGTAGNSTQCFLTNSPFVRANRGRHSRLTPTSSLPSFLHRELEDNCSGSGSKFLTQPPESRRKGKEKEIDCSVHNKYPAERPAGLGPSPRSGGRSHLQLVPRDGRDEQSAIMVHCPPSCAHESCYHSRQVLSVPTVEASRPAGSRYVDACVSPIITITGRAQDTNSAAKNCSEELDLNRDYPHKFVGSTHVSHEGIDPETDVRSPIAKGTMVPMNAAEMERMRWRNASRARRLTSPMGLSTLSDLARFSVAGW